MGMFAVRASSGTTPRINDLVVRGYILSVDEGSATKRVAIGFGSGASELKAAAEGFQMTAQGLPARRTRTRSPIFRSRSRRRKARRTC